MGLAGRAVPLLRRRCASDLQRRWRTRKEPSSRPEWWRGTQSHYRTTGQSRNIRLVPLYEIDDEGYEIYFPLRKTKP